MAVCIGVTLFHSTILSIKGKNAPGLLCVSCRVCTDSPDLSCRSSRRSPLSMTLEMFSCITSMTSSTCDCTLWTHVSERHRIMNNSHESRGMNFLDSAEIHPSFFFSFLVQLPQHKEPDESNNIPPSLYLDLSSWQPVKSLSAPAEYQLTCDQTSCFIHVART